MSDQIESKVVYVDESALDENLSMAVRNLFLKPATLTEDKKGYSAKEAALLLVNPSFISPPDVKKYGIIFDTKKGNPPVLTNALSSSTASNAKSRLSLEEIKFFADKLLEVYNIFQEMSEVVLQVKAADEKKLVPVSFEKFVAKK